MGLLIHSYSQSSAKIFTFYSMIQVRILFNTINLMLPYIIFLFLYRNICIYKNVFLYI